MFLTGTVGIIIGGPLAILIVSIFSPETVGGAGFDAVWRGLATIAGSWIGGGANQAAMLEVFQFNQEKYGGMVLIDIVMANVWMAIILFGIGRSNKIDAWLKADNSSIEELKEKVTAHTKKIARVTSLPDFIMLLFYAFAGAGIAHFVGHYISEVLEANFEVIRNKEKMLSSLGSKFLWMVVVATFIGIALSFTKAKNYEGAGPSKIGGVFIYILVATIGMKMDLGRVLENPGLILIGLIWISIHALLLILVAKLIRAPYFFLAVGSQANVGGAASAPVVAAEFHPSLTSEGIFALLMEVASQMLTSVEFPKIQEYYAYLPRKIEFMKQILSIFLLGMLVFSCGEDHQFNMTVSGNIDGLKKGMLYFQQFKDSSLVNLDSLEIKGDGGFTFYHNLESPEVLYLFLKKQRI